MLLRITLENPVTLRDPPARKKRYILLGVGGVSTYNIQLRYMSIAQLLFLPRCAIYMKREGF